MNLKKKLYELVKKQPYGTCELAKIGDIIIPRVMKRRHPAQWKIDRALEFYREHNYVDKPILVESIVNEKGKPNQLILVDNYTRYLVIKSQSQTRVPVQYIENK